ncbi:DUF4412 domain-containing protein [Aequorivita sp. SDUM287046]|uniref:DUF4412 domain-containing protein n=1 Tax=Aequorivita aurantiaca TaxID=3053356 RepID=A0ABT8DGI8_9FLAO|nr:DUF4412 domain-containing protein [Aequorivita aurantiaca]MDN3724033.1 DUF4412 domain-containing protein [Aequorivita aurantiaca]
MKNILKITLVLIFCCYASHVNAQIFKKLGEKVERSIERKLDNKANEQESKLDSKIDEGVDTVIDAPEKAIEEETENNKKKKKEKKSEKNNNIIGSDADDDNESAMDFGNILNSMNNAQNVEISGSYNFNNKVVYEIDTGANKKEQITYWFGTDDGIFGVEMGADVNAFIVYDLEKETMLMLSKKDKTMQVIPMSMFGDIYKNLNTDEEEDTSTTFNKVSGKKKIIGYNCDKYEMKSEDIKGEFWFSKEVDFDMGNFSKSILTLTKKSNEGVPNVSWPQNGFMMEMTTTDVSSNTTTKMTVIELLKKEYSINTSEYQRSGF